VQLDPSQAPAVIEQLRTLYTSAHPNNLGFHGVAYQQLGASSCVVLYSEFMDLGSLQGLYQRFGPLPEPVRTGAESAALRTCHATDPWHTAVHHVLPHAICRQLCIPYTLHFAWLCVESIVIVPLRSRRRCSAHNLPTCGMLPLPAVVHESTRALLTADAAPRPRIPSLACLPAHRRAGEASLHLYVVCHISSSDMACGMRGARCKLGVHRLWWGFADRWVRVRAHAPRAGLLAQAEAHDPPRPQAVQHIGTRKHERIRLHASLQLRSGGECR
jgi:hypothetical protein